MRAYADSSFILRLITKDDLSDKTAAEYRRLRCPKLFFTPLHELEVRNSILQRAFYQKRSLSSGERQHVSRERDAAFARLEKLLARKTLLEVSVDWERAIARATSLSSAHSERIGARAIDVLHIGLSLSLESEVFLTCDERQAQLAKVTGTPVVQAI